MVRPGWEVFKRGYPLPYSFYGIFCGRGGWWNRVLLFVVPQSEGSDLSDCCSNFGFVPRF